MDMNPTEMGAFVTLFNRDGYVLDFFTAGFDTFTMNSIGVALCQKYNLSKGKSLISFISESPVSVSVKLLSDLFHYYETQYSNFDEETKMPESLFGEQHVCGKYRKQYLLCKELADKYKYVDPNEIRAEGIMDVFGSEYISRQTKMMVELQMTSPTDAIGKAKELVESCCRTILGQRFVECDKDWSFQQLVSKTFDTLKLLPKDVDEKSPIADSLKRILGSLKGMVSNISDIRNAYGSGHGRDA